MYNVAVVVGSLRRESANRRLARALEKLARGRLAFRFVDLAGLPVYDDDLWEEPPAAVLRMKSEIEAADAVLLVTPEYNRSVPPVLKNAIDWATRPWGENSWADKPAAIVGASPGAIGTAAAQGHLRDIMVVVGAVVMGQPEVYLALGPELIDDDYTVTDETTRSFLAGWVERFEDWIARTGRRAAEAESTASVAA